MMRRRSILAVLLAVSASVCASGQPRQKVILDTDIGDDIDDAWALAFILSHPELDTVGVTMTFGDTAARARIACKMLHISLITAPTVVPCLYQPPLQPPPKE